MGRRVISDDIAARAASLRRRGRSFRAIGAALGIDPRTAKSLASRVASGDQQAHWEAVERQLDARFLDEHFQLLLYAGMGVLRAVETHPEGTAASVDPEVWLAHQVSSALAQAEELLLRRGIGKEAGLDQDVEIPPEVSQRLLEGLMEHEPTLAAALDGPDGWIKQWRRFQTSRQQLMEVALALLKQQGYEGELASGMAESAVQTALRQEAKWGLGSRTVSEPTTPDTQSARDYAWLLQQISHRERLRILLESEMGVKEAASKVGQAVRELQLRSRPYGRCSLCPSKGGA